MDAPPTFLFKPPPPFPAPSQTFDVSPLEFVLALFAVITIPTLIYTFFLFIKCPPNPFRPRRQSSGGLAGELTSRQEDNKGNLEQVSGVKYRKEIHVKDIGSECPVCLSVFVDGEEIRQLTVCKHSFHSSCVDIWLSSHANCPVCRASVAVAVKASNRPSVAGVAGEADLRQGLPDSASLV
ncbi:hypothetical protein L1049_008930 [Liquidambar formosana]|uniref:RING-type domain-containing protein n=1 Tax=Liquidambar formosana TaxID=63359 RepID=A0AAP0X2L4_LIQFO